MYTLTVDGNQNSVITVQTFLHRFDPHGQHLAVNTGKAAIELASVNTFDVIIMETTLSDSVGLEAARLLRKLQPLSDLMFMTRNPEYAVQAFELFAVGYLIKPVQEYQLQEVFANLRNTKLPRNTGQPLRMNKIRVQCFGTFEAFHDGTPIRFRTEGSKMLFAFLIDRIGEMCTKTELASALLTGRDPDNASIDPLRLWIADLQTTLTLLGEGELLIRKKDQIGLHTDMVDCDYYDWLGKNAASGNNLRPPEKYMSQYSFEKKVMAVKSEPVIE